MKVTAIPIVNGSLVTVTKGLVKRTRGLGNNITISCYCWEESWRYEETYFHSNSSERPSALADVKNSQGIKTNNNNNYNY